jgi:uncharacterized iron-regulated membrane protein/ferredoxin
MSGSANFQSNLAPHPVFKKARKVHKWLMAFCGLQILVWALTGAYMVFPNIHYIHGDHLVKSSMPNLDNSKVKLSFKQVLNRYPNASHIRLGWLGDKPVYRFNYFSQDAQKTMQVMLDAHSGLGVRPLQLVDVITLVPELLNAPNAHELKIASVRLIDKDTINFPREIGTKGLPLWQVELDTWDSTRLYISEYTGEVVYVRHHAWRLFDFFWRLHIMDYTSGDNPANWLLAISSIISLCAIFAGLMLLYFKMANAISNQRANPSTKTPWLKKSIGGKAKQSHQWIALFIFAQLILWAGSGFLLGRIDHPLASGQTTKLPQASQMTISARSATELAGIESILTSGKHVEGISFEALGEKWVYQIQHSKARHDYLKSDYSLVDANTGEPLIISESLASELALATYNSEVQPIKAAIISAKKYASGIPALPQEQNAVWELSINDDLNTQIILHAQTGALIAHVNDKTYLRNLLFKLHFMDYANNGSFNNVFIKLFALLSLLLSFTGLYWLFTLLKDRQFALPLVWLFKPSIEAVPTPRSKIRTEVVLDQQVELDAWLKSKPNPILQVMVPISQRRALDEWFASKLNPRLTPKVEVNQRAELDAWLAAKPNPRLRKKVAINQQAELDAWFNARVNPRLTPKVELNQQAELDAWFTTKLNPVLRPKEIAQETKKSAKKAALLAQSKALAEASSSLPDIQSPATPRKKSTMNTWGDRWFEFWSWNFSISKQQELQIKVCYSVPNEHGKTETMYKIKADPRQTILDGLASYRFSLASQCGGGGVCSKCICQPSNKTRVKTADKEQLSKEQLKQNFRLGCQHKIGEVKQITLYK